MASARASSALWDAIMEVGVGVSRRVRRGVHARPLELFRKVSP